MHRPTPELIVENLAKEIAENGTIDVRLERQFGTLTGRTWLELNGGILSDELEGAIFSDLPTLKPIAVKVLSEKVDSLFQRSVTVASDPKDVEILQEELKKFQQGEPIHFRLHTHPSPGWDIKGGIPFFIKKPAASSQS